MAKSLNILVPFDNSPNSKRALVKAINLATIAHGSISLVHVISYHKAMAKIVQPYKGKLITHVRKFLKDAKHSGLKKGVLSDQYVLYGNPSEEILKLIKKKDFDLVIMGRRGTSKLTGPTLGSVSNALVQGSNIPVMIVK